jgi:hypothetical protein
LGLGLGLGSKKTRFWVMKTTIVNEWVNECMNEWMMHWEWGADFAHIIMNERKRRFLGIWGGGVGWGHPWGLDSWGL